MATLTELEARLAALEEIRDSGVGLLRQGDTTTQFRSMDEVLRAIAAVKAQIATASKTPRRVRFQSYQPRKGL